MSEPTGKRKRTRKKAKKRKSRKKGIRRFCQYDYWFQEITKSDLKFMAVLTSSEFINPWVQVWVASPLENSADSLQLFFIISLALKVLTAVMISIVVDLTNHKFKVYLISMFLFLLVPVFGIIAAVVENVVLYLVQLSLTYTMFVTYPVKFCLAFNQRPNASIAESRQLVALFEMIQSVSTALLFCFLFFEHKNIFYIKFTRAFVIVVWTIGFVLIAGLIILTFTVKKYCTNENIQERNIRELLRGIKQDVIVNREDSQETMERKQMHRRRFLYFILLLLPVLVITSFDVTLQNIYNKHTEEQFSNELFKFVAKLFILPGVGLLFSSARGFWGGLADLMMIAGAHVFNIFIIFLMVQHLRIQSTKVRHVDDSGTEEYTVIVGKLPNSKQAVIGLFGASPFGFFVYTANFHTDYPKGWVEFFVDVENGPQILELLIRKKSDGEALKFNLEVAPNERHWFVLLSQKDEYTELVRVQGCEYTFTEEAKLFILSGYVKGEPPPQEFALFDAVTKTDVPYVIPANNMTERIVLKPGSYQVKYATFGTKFTLFKPYSESVFLVFYDDTARKHRFRQHFNMLEVHPGAPTTKSPFLLTDRELIETSNAVSGFTQAAANVGYIHFFWMESPTRLRTTILAGFFVINEVTAELTRIFVNDIQLYDAYLYLGMSIFAGTLHIVLGFIYELRYRQEKDRPTKRRYENEEIDDETDAPQESSGSHSDLDESHTPRHSAPFPPKPSDSPRRSAPFPPKSVDSSSRLAPSPSKSTDSQTSKKEKKKTGWFFS